MERAQIMVVEDEAIVALDIQRKLEDIGYSVIAVIRSGEEAVRTACELRPDLILMDISLQGDLDGISAAAAIQDRGSIPVIFLTALADKDTLERAKITEPMGYLIKPFEEQDLRAAVEVVLHKHHMDVTRGDALREHAKEAVKERTAELAQRHRELAALNTVFQQHLIEREAESQVRQKIRFSANDFVHKMRHVMDEFDRQIHDESITFDDPSNGNPTVDRSLADNEQSNLEQVKSGPVRQSQSAAG